MHQLYQLLSALTTKARLATRDKNEQLYVIILITIINQLRHHNHNNLKRITSTTIYFKIQTPMRTCDVAAGTSCLRLNFSSTTKLLQYNFHHCIHHTIINITDTTHDD